MAIPLTHAPVPMSAPVDASASWTTRVGASLLRACTNVWISLEGVGQRRAQQELRRLAANHSPQSELGRQLREAAQWTATSGE